MLLLHQWEYLASPVATAADSCVRLNFCSPSVAYIEPSRTIKANQ